jgi:hypothetical protein
MVPPYGITSDMKGLGFTASRSGPRRPSLLLAPALARVLLGRRVQVLVRQFPRRIQGHSLPQLVGDLDGVLARLQLGQELRTLALYVASEALLDAEGREREVRAC